MKEQLSYVKARLDNLDNKYPDTKITCTEEEKRLCIKVDDAKIELDYELIKDGLEMHGTKFLNAIIDMIEKNMIQKPE